LPSYAKVPVEKYFHSVELCPSLPQIVPIC
jgi:hypothetical protein